MRRFTLITGPTASGKSALAIKLAQAAHPSSLIVNADSMQVYSALRILSARPSVEDEAQVPHRLFGFVDSREEYSVGRYLADLTPLVTQAREGEGHLILVGGTGLYFRAITEGLVPTPAIPPDIRHHWRARAAEGDDLHSELAKRDPLRAARLNPADTPRILRAIELFEATGRPYSDWLAENPGTPLLKPGEWRGVFVNPPREALKATIDARFETMLANGALEEVAGLLAQQPPLSRNLGVMKAHGVPHLIDYLEGRITKAEAVMRGQGDTRAYARRQVIFARRYLAAPGWTWAQNADQAADCLP